MTGSGKTHLAKMLRDIEREEKGACRILSLDDYFLQVTHFSIVLPGPVGGDSMAWLRRRLTDRLNSCTQKPRR